jgi:hypothetical protein
MIPYEMIPNNMFGKLMAALLADKSIKSATYYIRENLIVRARAQTYKYRKGKRTDNRSNRETFTITVGAPNYAERQFIKQLVKAGEPFPVKKMQLKYVKNV